MRYKGRKIEGRNSDILVLIKNGEKIMFKAEAVSDYAAFEKLVPLPTPPQVLRPGGVREANIHHPEYKKALEAYAESKTNYLIIKSLEASQDVEWDNIDATKPDTWKNWKTELTESGFTEIEILRIVQLCTRVNSLDDEMLEEAKNDFLRQASQPEE